MQDATLSGRFDLHKAARVIRVLAATGPFHTASWHANPNLQAVDDYTVHDYITQTKVCLHVQISDICVYQCMPSFFFFSIVV